MKPRTRRILCAVAVLALLAVRPAHAAVIQRNATNNNLNLAAAWSGGVVPGAADTAQWGALSTGNYNKALGASMAWGKIEILSPGGNITIANTAAAVLTLNGVGGVGIDMSAATRDLTIGNNLVTLGGAQSWTVQTGRTLTISGTTLTLGGNALTLNGAGATVITGAAAVDAGSIVMNNASGALTLGGTNLHTGGVTLSAGTLNINNAGALGTGTFTIAGGTINNTSGGAITNTNNNAQAWNGNFTFTGANDLNLGTGAVTMNASRQVTVSANKLTVGGAISGIGFGLTKEGAGTLTLEGANTYTGTTTINLGVLAITKATGLGTTAGNTIVNSGNGTTPGGQLQISGGITVAEPLTISGAGNSGYNGALVNTANTNTWSGPITLGANGDNRITVTGGTLNVTGGITGDAAGKQLTLSNGTTLTVSTNPILLDGAATVNSHSGGTNTLNVGGNTFGTLKVQYASTFKIGLNDAVPTSADLVLGATPSGGESGTFNLNGLNQTIDQLGSGTAAGLPESSFVTPGGTRKVTSGVAGSCTLTVGSADGSSLFDGVIQNGSGTVALTKIGSGTLTLAGANTYSGDTTTSAGTLEVGGAGQLGSGIYAGDIAIAGMVRTASWPKRNRLGQDPLCILARSARTQSDPRPIVV